MPKSTPMLVAGQPKYVKDVFWLPKASSELYKEIIIMSKMMFWDYHQFNDRRLNSIQLVRAS